METNEDWVRSYIVRAFEQMGDNVHFDIVVKLLSSEKKFKEQFSTEPNDKIPYSEFVEWLVKN